MFSLWFARACMWLTKQLSKLYLVVSLMMNFIYIDLLSALLSCTDSSHQDGFMLRLIYMFLGCDMPIQLVLSSEYDDYDRLYGVAIDTDQSVATYRAYSGGVVITF